MYVYNAHPLSEEMLLGIGGGVGFIYWHMQGDVPFIGGRAKGRPGSRFEKSIGERTGVRVDEYITSSVRKAESSMLALLEIGQPVMVQCDMGYLPYFDFGGYDYHFGAHYIVVCGYDVATNMTLVADRDLELHSVSLEDISRARGSTYKPYPPKNRWFSFDFTHKRQPTEAEIKQALREQMEGMLNPPISNLGVKGIRKAARRSLKWPQELDAEMLRITLFNTHIFIDADGGTGGGIFRYMFSRFLREVADLLGESNLTEIADRFLDIGDRWQKVAVLFKEGWEAENPEEYLAETSEQMLAIADIEELAWGDMQQLIK
jgi:hypothetical protein